MTSHRRSNVCCPIPLLLAAFGALALLISIPGCSAQNLDSQLIESASRGETEKVKALLESGADVEVEAKYMDGLTALMAAALKGHTDTVQALLDAGADVEAKNNDGESALMLATFQGHTDIVELLKKAGAKE